jgi:hypothetical protein
MLQFEVFVEVFGAGRLSLCSTPGTFPARGRLSVMETQPAEPKKPQPAEPSRPPAEVPGKTPPVEDPRPGNPNEDRPLVDPIPPDGDQPRM